MADSQKSQGSGGGQECKSRLNKAKSQLRFLGGEIFVCHWGGKKTIHSLANATKKTDKKNKPKFPYIPQIPRIKH